MAERTPLRAHPVPSVLGLRGGLEDDDDIAILRLLMSKTFLAWSMPHSPLDEQTQEVGFRARCKTLIPRLPTSARVGVEEAAVVAKDGVSVVSPTQCRMYKSETSTFVDRGPDEALADRPHAPVDRPEARPLPRRQF